MNQGPVNRQVKNRKISPSKKEWFVKAYKSSSLTIKGFCTENGINPGTFKNWLYKGHYSSKIRFTEVVCETLKRRSVKIILENGLKVEIEVENAKELFTLVRELKSC